MLVCYCPLVRQKSLLVTLGQTFKLNYLGPYKNVASTTKVGTNKSVIRTPLNPRVF